MKHLFTSILIFFSFFSSSQSREEMFDHAFKPANTSNGYYYAVTEKRDSIWKRQAWNIFTKKMYMEGWYKDDSCKIGHGPFKWYHSNGYLYSTGEYVNGYKDGIWLEYNESGQLKDSTNFIAGRRKGIGLSWHDNGYPADSTNFDGNGNGVQVKWHDDGSVSAAGYWMEDTLNRGKWKYYHRNGTLMATEDYDAAGKLIVCNCYDEKGIALDTSFCREKEAVVDLQQWRRFLERGLQPLVEQKAVQGITGHFTVLLRFIVNQDGSLSEIKPLTNYGHGIEEGVIKIFKNAPIWTPASIHGKKVKSYHTQPVTFMIVN